MPELTVLTVNYNTSDFIECMLYCLHRITYYPFKVLMADNFYSHEEKLRLNNICQKYNNVDIFYRNQSQSGSMGHGEALDMLTKKVDTEYFSILDADATFLVPNWDKLLIATIDARCKVIGTQPPIHHSKKNPDFPLMFAILFETETFQELSIEFKPPLKGEIPYGKDTGYQLRQKYKNANKEGRLLCHAYSINRLGSPFYGIACAEYFFPGNDAIFASHFWRGASLSMSEMISRHNRVYDFVQKTPIIGGKIIRSIRNRQKIRWLNICKRIVDQ